jgi:putative transcriptional regulator
MNENLSPSNLNDQFLIAMPQLQDSFFENSVVYIWQHSEEGAIGIAVNLPLPIELSELLEQMAIEDERPAGASQFVLSGGPVEPHKGFILHDGSTRKTFEATLPLENGLFLTSSRDILEAIASNQGPEKYLVVLGCSGWGPGQLEQELSDNAWFTCPATKDLIFSTRFAEKPKLAAALLGFDLSQLSTDIGTS